MCQQTNPNPIPNPNFHLYPNPDPNLYPDPTRPPQLEVARYRPNIVVGGGGLQPFAEDAWHDVALGPHRLTVDGASLPSVADKIAADAIVLNLFPKLLDSPTGSLAKQFLCMATMCSRPPH